MVIPRLTPNLKSGEFKQYYFLKEELKDFCRQEGLKVTGNKGDLEKRIIHYLDTGEKLTEPAIKIIWLKNLQKSHSTLKSVKTSNAVKTK